MCGSRSLTGTSLLGIQSQSDCKTAAKCCGGVEKIATGNGRSIGGWTLAHLKTPSRSILRDILTEQLPLCDVRRFLVHLRIMKWFAAVLGLALVLLQYRLWLSEDGVRGVIQMRAAVAAQRAQNDRLAERNLQLAAEVRDLKQGDEALEERARNDLGMIATGETFIQVVQGRGSPSVNSAAPATPPTRSAAH